MISEWYWCVGIGMLCFWNSLWTWAAWLASTVRDVSAEMLPHHARWLGSYHKCCQLPSSVLLIEKKPSRPAKLAVPSSIAEWPPQRGKYSILDRLCESCRDKVIKMVIVFCFCFVVVHLSRSFFLA